MYTQCPECATSFRVTADVLKQAAGKVRCGGCGAAFNALDYLSEGKPEPAAHQEAQASLPELTPDPVEALDEPQTISPEQSAALLKTLDELAGSDIRLEDTGFEWRVMDDLDDETPADASIDDSVDEGADTKDETESPPEVVEEPEQPAEAESVEDDLEELRFDDETGLPEEFDDAVGAEAALVPADDESEAPAPPPQQLAAPEADLAFGDAEEWGALLEEVVPEQTGATDFALHEAIIEPEPSPEDSGPTFAEELAALPDEGDLDELPDLAPALGSKALADDLEADIPPDIDTQFDLQAEALGIEPSGIRQPEEASDAVEPEVDIPDSTAALELELLEAQASATMIEAAVGPSIDADTEAPTVAMPPDGDDIEAQMAEAAMAPNDVSVSIAEQATAAMPTNDPQTSIEKEATTATPTDDADAPSTIEATATDDADAPSTNEATATDDANAPSTIEAASTDDDADAPSTHETTATDEADASTTNEATARAPSADAVEASTGE